MMASLQKRPLAPQAQGLIRHCTPLLNLYGDLLAMEQNQTSAESLFSELHRMVKELEIMLGSANFNNEVVKLSSYSLCCALDEAMSRCCSSNGNSISSSLSLLFSFHNEMPQSASLLKLAKRIIDQRNPALAEVQTLIYMIIELGYRGTMLETPDNANMLYSIKRVLANNVIDSNKGRPALNSARNEPRQRKQKSSGIPLWVSLSFSALILFSAYRIGDIYLSSTYQHVSDDSKTTRNR